MKFKAKKMNKDGGKDDTENAILLKKKHSGFYLLFTHTNSIYF